MAKSSLKTFLAGKNEVCYHTLGLRGSNMLEIACEDILDPDVHSNFYDENVEIYAIDVLDDGTAITYKYGK